MFADDPELGRFLQADSMVENDATQGLNRYTYVLNNPLSLTDPTGHLSKNSIGILKAIVSIAISVWLPGSGFLFGANTFGASVFAGFLGGVVTGGLEGGLWGAFSAGLFRGIGSNFDKVKGAKGSGVFGSGFKAGAYSAKVLAHATAGGTLNVLQGGKFGHGFVSAGITEAVSPSIAQIGNDYAEVAAAAIVGGTTSALSGGKFGNGAITSAFGYAFNELSPHDRYYGDEKNTRVKERTLTEGEISMLDSVFEGSVPGEDYNISQKNIGPTARALGDNVTFDFGVDYRHDFSSETTTKSETQTFFHEFGHHWWYRKYGQPSALLGISFNYIVSGGDAQYSYTFDINRTLKTYKPEQRAEIIGDYGRAIYLRESTIQNSGRAVPTSEYKSMLTNSGFPK